MKMQSEVPPFTNYTTDPIRWSLRVEAGWARANPGEDFRPQEAVGIASSQYADMSQRNIGIAHGCVADDRSDGWPHTPATRVSPPLQWWIYAFCGCSTQGFAPRTLPKARS